MGPGFALPMAMKRWVLAVLIVQLYALTWVLSQTWSVGFCHNSTIVQNVVISQGVGWIPSCDGLYKTDGNSWKDKSKKWLDSLNSGPDLWQIRSSMRRIPVPVNLIVNEAENINPEVEAFQVYLSTKDFFDLNKRTLLLLESFYLQKKMLMKSTVVSRAISQVLGRLYGNLEGDLNLSYDHTSNQLAQVIWTYSQKLPKLKRYDFVRNVSDHGVEKLGSIKTLSWAFKQAREKQIPRVQLLAEVLIRPITPLGVDAHHLAMREVLSLAGVEAEVARLPKKRATF